MSRASDARRQKRAAARRGVIAVDRVTIDGAAIAAAVLNGASLVDFLAYNVAEALNRLDIAGYDVPRHTVVTMGERPGDAPGDITIEVKVAHAKDAPAEHADGCDCPIDHSADGTSDDDA